jgi:hypothetical protein
LTELGDWAEWGTGLDNLVGDDDDGDDDSDQAFKDLGRDLNMLRQMAGLASDICASGGVVNCLVFWLVILIFCEVFYICGFSGNNKSASSGQSQANGSSGAASRRTSKSSKRGHTADEEPMQPLSDPVLMDWEDASAVQAGLPLPGVQAASASSSSSSSSAAPAVPVPTGIPYRDIKGIVWLQMSSTTTKRLGNTAVD